MDDHNDYYSKRLLSSLETNKYIAQAIMSGEPLFVGRFGATELSAIRIFDFQIKSKYKKVLKQMEMWSGFFPIDISNGKKFCDLMLEDIKDADLIGVWHIPFEGYYLNKYGSRNLFTTQLLDLEPWKDEQVHWSYALKGKRVLIIHPFEDTIKNQYKKRNEIYEKTDILPEFELITLKAVQTIAGSKDQRFRTWFEALDWMYEEAMKKEFDVAIIGCGAYGFPLAAKLKRAGKQAIHLGGATQLMFGIKGKRWERSDAFNYVKKYFNESWTYPLSQDTPLKAEKVEDGCYWK